MKSTCPMLNDDSLMRIECKDCVPVYLPRTAQSWRVERGFASDTKCSAESKRGVALAFLAEEGKAFAFPEDCPRG